MSRWTGLALIAAGLGGAAFVYPMLSTETDTRRDADASLARGVSPPATRSTDPARAATIEAAAPRGNLVLQPKSQPIETVIAAAPLTPPVAPLAKPIEAPQPILKVNRGDDSRMSLARDIQRELARVGCYRGVLDGSWSADTRAAMKVFIDRVNASLPVDEPDHILKTLVQGHPGSACGPSCPSGQNLTADGRCLPTAIMAQVPKRLPRDTTTAPAPYEVAPPMAPVTRNWDAIITGAASNRPEAAPTPALPPLPGRMAIGAPVPSVSPPDAIAPPPAFQLAPRQRPGIDPPQPLAALSTAVPPAPGLQPSITEPTRPELGRPAVRPSGRSNNQARRSASFFPGQNFFSAYSPPRSAKSRQRFGPGIFRQMERDSR